MGTVVVKRSLLPFPNNKNSRFLRLCLNLVLRTGTFDNGCHRSDNDLVMKLQIRSANTRPDWTGAKTDKSRNKWRQK